MASKLSRSERARVSSSFENLRARLAASSTASFDASASCARAASSPAIASVIWIFAAFVCEVVCCNFCCTPSRAPLITAVMTRRKDARSWISELSALRVSRWTDSCTLSPCATVSRTSDSSLALSIVLLVSFCMVKISFSDEASTAWFTFCPIWSDE